MPATLADIQAKYGDSVYPLYKDQMHEPYMENETKNGYRGTVLYDEKSDKVQCSECGKWYQSLATHIKAHKLTGKEYKDKHGLYYSVALCSKDLSEIHSESAKINYPRNNSLSRTGNSKGIEKLGLQTKKRMSKMQAKNTYGLCDAQIAARLEVVRDMVGTGKIESADIKKYDRKLYQNLIDTYGSTSNACKKIGINSSKPTHKYEDSDLIAKLRHFVIDKKRIPKRNDMREGLIPTDKVFTRVFGSWRRAKMMAGLDQLLEEVKS